MKRTILMLTLLGAVMTACNGPKNEKTGVMPSQEEKSGKAMEVSITLNAGDNMKFDKAEIRVKEGQTVKLTLNHTGKMSKEAMGHNFVLLALGVSPGDFGVAAMAAKENGYIPQGTQDVLVHTNMIGGGETATVEFPAPAKGEYDYLCSFPGHAALMKGKFIVE